MDLASRRGVLRELLVGGWVAVRLDPGRRVVPILRIGRPALV